MNPIRRRKQEIENSNHQFNDINKQLPNSTTNSTCSHRNCEQKKPTLTLAMSGCMPLINPIQCRTQAISKSDHQFNVADK